MAKRKTAKRKPPAKKPALPEPSPKESIGPPPSEPVSEPTFIEKQPLEKVCLNCRHWRPTNDDTPDGICRRWPPRQLTALGEATQPTTRASATCGEFAWR